MNRPDDVRPDDPFEPELEQLGDPEKAQHSPRMLVPLFLVPLIIVAAIVGVFFGFGALVGEPDSPEELLHRIESGGVNSFSLRLV